ncbi:uncharacterized protein LOC128250541 isoform X2 [Octopus bimaculoides]|uniref:uncharacterized protein LOC128250541 isoform X2 n=1 Tax=Octopus bimaculoides TaxID=37653 RepID=UPI0022E8D7AF|nr:uncharacterized protein LOC128250541 isoform X2 [Octopus bimaculoides]
MRNDNIMAIIEYRLFDNQSCCSSEVYHQESRCVMKGISVLLFCAFISYSFSDEQNVTSVHRQTTANVSLNNMTHSDRIKRDGATCSLRPCAHAPIENCCKGHNCICYVVPGGTRCVCVAPEVDNAILQTCHIMVSIKKTVMAELAVDDRRYG